jgi:hypothetical protein
MTSFKEQLAGVKYEVELLRHDFARNDKRYEDRFARVEADIREIKKELMLVERARGQAAELVGDFYVLAPREWDRMHYEVRTLSELAPEEVCDEAFAQVLCYDRVRHAGPAVAERHDLYRICLQDHRILRAIEAREMNGEIDLEPFLVYILTHELVHVVRFSQRMQHPDLPVELRPIEELSVEQTTQKILSAAADLSLQRVIAGYGWPPHRSSSIPSFQTVLRRES